MKITLFFSVKIHQQIFHQYEQVAHIKQLNEWFPSFQFPSMSHMNFSKMSTCKDCAIFLNNSIKCINSPVTTCISILIYFCNISTCFSSVESNFLTSYTKRFVNSVILSHNLPFYFRVISINEWHIADPLFLLCLFKDECT